MRVGVRWLIDGWWLMDGWSLICLWIKLWEGSREWGVLFWILGFWVKVCDLFIWYRLIDDFNFFFLYEIEKVYIYYGIYWFSIMFLWFCLVGVILFLFFFFIFGWIFFFVFWGFVLIVLCVELFFWCCCIFFCFCWFYFVGFDVRVLCFWCEIVLLLLLLL